MNYELHKLTIKCLIALSLEILSPFSFFKGTLSLPTFHFRYYFESCSCSFSGLSFYFSDNCRKTTKQQ